MYYRAGNASPSHRRIVCVFEIHRLALQSKRERQMNHRDAEMTEVVVVLDDLSTEQTNAVVEKLKSAGMEVFKVDNDQSLVEGCVESCKALDLNKLDHVRYVRNVLTYTVDYPPGDPRDKDGPDDDD
jgi:hypothetical protein